jgi:tRNA threonylcarbamoyladenosine biosynthesis protein TsaB
MNLLAIDTVAGLCAAALLDTSSGRELGRSVRNIGRGHVEQLMEVIEEALAGRPYREIGRIGVAVGPGSFTGVRVGVSAARGLSLALGVPAAGISTLSALAAEAADRHPHRKVLVAIAAGRGAAYWLEQDAAGIVTGGPDAAPIAAIASRLDRSDWAVAGDAARLVAGAAEITPAFGPEAATADIATYARLAALARPEGPPRPLYLRQADAKPQESGLLLRSHP